MRLGQRATTVAAEVKGERTLASLLYKGATGE